MTAHRAPPRLTKRGRAVLELAAVKAILDAAVASGTLLVGYYTVVQWLGQALGTA